MWLKRKSLNERERENQRTHCLLSAFELFASIFDSCFFRNILFKFRLLLVLLNLYILQCTHTQLQSLNNNRRFRHIKNICDNDIFFLFTLDSSNNRWKLINTFYWLSTINWHYEIKLINSIGKQIASAFILPFDFAKTKILLTHQIITNIWLTNSYINWLIVHYRYLWLRSLFTNIFKTFEIGLISCARAHIHSHSRKLYPIYIVHTPFVEWSVCLFGLFLQPSELNQTTSIMHLIDSLIQLNPLFLVRRFFLLIAFLFFLVHTKFTQSLVNYL